MTDGRGLTRKKVCIRGHDLTVSSNRVAGKGACLLCSKLSSKKWRATEHGKEAKASYAKIYDNTKHGKKLKAARDKRYSQTPKGKEAARKHAIERNNNPEAQYYKMRWALRNKMSLKSERIAGLEAELERILHGEKN